MVNQTPSYDNVSEHRGFIESQVGTVPIIRCHALEEKLGLKRVFFVWYGGLITGSFKVLGALNYAKRAKLAGDVTELFTHSSGNWAAAIAFAGKQCEIPVTVYMNPGVSQHKRDNTTRWGAKVKNMTGEPDELTRQVTSIAETSGGVFVSPYDHKWIVEGHAIGGLHIVDYFSKLTIDGVSGTDLLKRAHYLVQVSGGGLSAGTTLALRHEVPKHEGLHITGVEPTGCNDFALSLAAGTIQSIAEPRKSKCGGLLANSVGQSNWAVLGEHVNDALAISDETTQAAMWFLLESAQLMVEHSGAITVAAAMEPGFQPKGDILICAISGSNIAPKSFYEDIGIS